MISPLSFLVVTSTQTHSERRGNQKWNPLSDITFFGTLTVE